MTSNLFFVENKDLYHHYYCQQTLIVGVSYSFDIYYLLDDSNFFHHDTLPSVITIDSSGFNRCDYYFTHGILHRKDGPAKISYSLDNTEKLFFTNDKNIFKVSSLFHSYHDDLSLIKGHSLAGKELIVSLSSLAIKPVYHLTNSYPKRQNGPEKIKESYFRKIYMHEKNGELHREDGPAVIHIDGNGKTYRCHWYLEGELIEAWIK